MKKRIAALLLSLCLCLTLAAPASAAEEDPSTIDVYVTQLEPGYYLCAVWDGDLLLCLFDYTVGSNGIMAVTVDIGEVLPSGSQVKVGISSANTGGKQVSPVYCTVYNAASDSTASPDRPSGAAGQVTTTPTRVYYNISIPNTSGGTVSVASKTSSPNIYIPVTVEPSPGYKLASLSASDSTGRDIQVPCINGQYRFYMPSSNVTLRASFVPDSGSTVPITNRVLLKLRDVHPGDYYYDAANWAVEQGITGGLVNTIFEPQAPCTRSQAVTFLWRAMGSPQPTPGVVSPFADAQPGQEHYAAVMWAMQQGIISGVSPTKFNASGSITRAQVSAMLYRAAGSPAAGGRASFRDVPSDAYYADAVQWAVDRGIVTGTSSTTFSPGSKCNRAQIVTLLYRFRAGSGELGTALPNIPPAPSAAAPAPEVSAPQSLSVGVSSSKSVQIAGSAYSVQFSLSAIASGGTGDYSYQFEVRQNGTVTRSTGWTSDNGISGTLSGNGTCVVEISVKDSSGATTSTSVDLLETRSFP